MRWIIIILTCSSYFVNENLLAQNSVHSEKLVQVKFNDGYLSVFAENTLLVELMQQVGTKAGFRVITFGDFSQQTSSWSISKLPLSKAIKKILKGSSAIISYREASDLNREADISTIYLIGSRPKTTTSIRFNSAQSSLSGQQLMDQIQFVKLPDRIIAVDRLQGLTDKITVNSLVFTLQHDPDPIVRIHAVTLLEKIGGTTGASALETGLGDDDSTVRIRIVRALGKIEDERSSLLLGQVLKGDPSSDVRFQAVFSIANKNNEESKLFLEAALDDKSDRVRDAAMQLLKTLQ